jgi:hypothetical protein
MVRTYLPIVLRRQLAAVHKADYARFYAKAYEVSED